MEVTRVPIDSIKPHPRNYRGHPSEQIEHIRASLRQYGQYRPIVVSRDGYILAGEGVWTGCKAEGFETVETVPQPFDHTDTRAEKLLVLDNEVSRAAIDDDKALATLLASIQQTEGLEGTGWDDGGLDKLIGEVAGEEFSHDGEIARELGSVEDEYTDVTFRVSRDQLEEINGALEKTGVPAKAEALMVIIEAYNAC